MPDTATMLNRRCARRQRGLSLVELLVGVAVGLFIVAGAAMVTATHLSDSRKLTVEAQIQQDLRATADIVTRELRRSGQWNGAATAVWLPGASVAANPNDAVTQTSTSDVAISTSKSDDVRGFQLAPGTPGVIQMKLGTSPWQALSDPSTLNVTQFDIAIVPVTTALACPNPCPPPSPTTDACWPQLEMRELQVTITASAVNDTTVVRSVRSATRLRNDRIVNRNGGGALCPS